MNMANHIYDNFLTIFCSVYTSVKKCGKNRHASIVIFTCFIQFDFLKLEISLKFLGGPANPHNKNLANFFNNNQAQI